MLENIRLAFQGIWSHMMRSFLTMLGIIIGIASIIAIVSTIKGTSEQIKEDLIGAGSNTVKIYLYDGDNQYDAEYGNSSKTPILTDDVKEEVKDLDHVENATFYYNSTSASIYNNNNSLEGGSVYGIDVNYLATCGYIIQSGRGFVKDDYKNYNKVALIDDNAAQNRLLTCPDSLFQSNLFGTLCNRNQHDIHDTNTAYKKRNTCNPDQLIIRTLTEFLHILDLLHNIIGFVFHGCISVCI